MILGDATFGKFGYEVWELSYGSHKPILAACDECGKVRETSKHDYQPLCGSCVKKGGINSLGYMHTEESKAKMSVAQKGNTNSLGHICSEITKAKLSVAMKGKYKGANNPNWRDGISFEPYCIKFNNAFKEYIRSKFGYKCFLCPTTQAENGKKLSVHHVNYNKNCGCDSDKTCQFVPLCKSCHAKTNGNRDYWQKIITDKLHCLIIGWNV